MNSVSFDVPARIASYSRLKKARKEAIKQLISVVETWRSSDFQHEQQLSLLKKSIQTHDFKFSYSHPTRNILRRDSHQRNRLAAQMPSSTNNEVDQYPANSISTLFQLGGENIAQWFVVQNYCSGAGWESPNLQFLTLLSFGFTKRRQFLRNCPNNTITSSSNL